MPGFTINAENAAQNKDNKAEFRRKHRWRLIQGSQTAINNKDLLYLKSAARPSFKFQEAEFHHDQEKAYLAGKQEWDPIELVFYDAVEGRNVDDIAEQLYSWVVSVCDIESATCQIPSEYKKTLIIQMTDAAGEVDESWILHGCWPVSTNWNNLDYTANDIQEVTVSVRFDRAIKDN